MQWIWPAEMQAYDCVPWLAAAYASLGNAAQPVVAP